MLDALLLLAPGALLAFAGLISIGRRAEAPHRGVRLFHDALLSGSLGEIGDCFSFSSAYEYWRDITASVGTDCPDEAGFVEMVMDLFADEEVLAELSTYRPACFRQKVIGSVGSVVFHKEGARPGEDTGVAAVVLEDGRWKVRTYPGVFPGMLLSRVTRAAGRDARKDSL